MNPADNSSAPLLWPKLLRAWGNWERIARKEWREILAAFGLSDQQWLLLLFADESSAPGRPQTELADDLNVSPAQVCVLLEDMRRREWMAATRCPPDRRRQYWQPTGAGRELLLECNAALLRWQADRLPIDCAARIEPICRWLAQLTPPSLPTPLSRGKEAA